MKTAYKYFNKVKLPAVYLAFIGIVLTGCVATASKGKDSDKSAQKQSAQPANVNTAASIDAPLVSANDSLLAMLRYSRFINGLSKEQLEDEFKRINDAYFIRPRQNRYLTIS